MNSKNSWIFPGALHITCPCMIYVHLPGTCEPSINYYLTESWKPSLFWSRGKGTYKHNFTHKIMKSFILLFNYHVSLQKLTCTFLSVSSSIDAVASSNRTIGVSLKRARARQRSWRCPTEKLVPPGPSGTFKVKLAIASLVNIVFQYNKATVVGEKTSSSEPC